jgi:hypothetical protein
MAAAQQHGSLASWYATTTAWQPKAPHCSWWPHRCERDSADLPWGLSATATGVPGEQLRHGELQRSRGAVYDAHTRAARRLLGFRHILANGSELLGMEAHTEKHVKGNLAGDG